MRRGKLRVQLDRLGKGPESAPQVALLLLDQAEQVVGVGVFGVDLDGVLDFQLGLDVIALGVQLLGLRVEFGLFLLRPAAGGQTQGQQH